jgi:hypothetical protein
MADLASLAAMLCKAFPMYMTCGIFLSFVMFEGTAKLQTGSVFVLSSCIGVVKRAACQLVGNK